VRAPWRGDRAERDRLRHLARAADGPLRAYLEVPGPPSRTPLEELGLLAVDIETTGLDPRTDRVLSVGFVAVDGCEVVLGTARRFVVSDVQGVGQSATLHGLTDDVLAAGRPIGEVLGALLAALSGRALLAHHARIETEFLGAACRRLWGAGLPCPVVDTLELEQRALTTGWGGEVAPGALRLARARERYGLPVYRAHEALTDAVACAELYLAQASRMSAGSPGTRATLRQVLA